MIYDAYLRHLNHKKYTADMLLVPLQNEVQALEEKIQNERAKIRNELIIEERNRLKEEQERLNREKQASALAAAKAAAKTKTIIAQIFSFGLVMASAFILFNNMAKGYTLDVKISLIFLFQLLPFMLLAFLPYDDSASKSIMSKGMIGLSKVLRVLAGLWWIAWCVIGPFAMNNPTWKLGIIFVICNAVAYFVSKAYHPDNLKA
jgi:hypothetical protein